MDNYDKTRDAFYAVQTARLAYECDPTPANKRRWGPGGVQPGAAELRAADSYRVEES